MTSTVTHTAKAAVLVGLALAIGAMGIYVADADDAPGAGGIGLLLMIGGVVLGVKAVRNRLPVWAGRTALAVGVLVAAFAAFLTHTISVTAPLFAQPRGVPSVAEPAVLSTHAPAAEHARELVRAAISEQNLPGVSVAVGGGMIVWAEGFGWRDVDTQTPVTPNTRFNIGTAASAVTAATIAQLGLTSTGADSATEWSPEHIGEPEEDFPLFSIIRRVVFRPIGMDPYFQPLPDDRATFYVPRSDGNPLRGRRLMYMRDLACCAGTMASYSTASDMVRIGLANGGSVDGELAGGMVTSLRTLPDNGVVVAVLSNIAHANTSALCLKIGETFSAR